jgi:4-hydroxybenzoate polyprenyltransferase
MVERTFVTERATGLGQLYELLRAMRPKQWVKNVFVFAALAFSQERLWRFWSPAAEGGPGAGPLARTLAGFVLFCAVAGAIYLINDLVDLEADRVHPKKRHRPLASGKLGPGLAVAGAIVALGGGLALGFWLEPWFGLALLAYFLIQGIAYSYYLKHVVILDIFVIAAGFVLRAVAGALLINVIITPWLLICMGLLALFMGVGKRRHELLLLEGGAGSHRRILDEYSVPMLDQMMAIMTAAVIMAYALFTFNAETAPLEPYPVLMVTIPFVVYAIFRYLYLVYRKGLGGAPEDLVLKDVPLALSIVGWGLTVLLVLFFFRNV